MLLPRRFRAGAARRAEVGCRALIALPLIVALACALSAACSAGAAGDPREGQIIVDPDNPAAFARYHETGEPTTVFLAGPGDPEDFLYRGSREANGTRIGDQDEIIDRLIAAGANTLFMETYRVPPGDGNETHHPFVDRARLELGLNEDVMQQWQSWLARLDAAEIATVLCLYDDATTPFGGAGRIIGETERQYVRAMVSRFKGMKNLIWCIAEEYSEANSTSNVVDLAAVVRTEDERAHPIAVHQVDGLSFDFATTAGIDQFLVQRNVHGDREAIHADMATAQATMMAGARRYNVALTESGGHYDALAPDREATRRFSWAAAMAGTYVMVLDMNVIDTPAAILEDHGRMVNFFERTAFAQLVSRDDLALGDTRYVLARPGVGYILYSESVGSAGLGARDLPAARYDVQWYDPQSGVTEVTAGVSVAGGDRVFSRPDGIGSEAVLYLADQSGLATAPLAPCAVAVACGACF